MVRFKNRYFLCRIDSEPQNAEKVSKVTTRELLNAIRYSLAGNFGDLAMGKLSTSLNVKYWTPALSLFLVRGDRDYFRTLWGTLTLITTLRPICDVGTVRITVLHVGGTIRSCTQSAIIHARQFILDAQDDGKDTANLQLAATSMQKLLQENEA